ncbi:MAG: dihydroneopterin aldolase [Candidatus Eremiobacteraeota bacterium]|nr:dihydroneopterin aldolase [Candidatus Eremiobacteraeota bacterium]
MSDVIELRGIRAYGRHGANPEERAAAQLFEIDLALEVDIAPARRSDELGDTVNYDALHERVVELVRDRSYFLLERLGDEIASLVLRDGRVRSVAVTIAKPRILAGATPAVTIRSTRR